jgi:nitrile hydratase beta subunit
MGYIAGVNGIHDLGGTDGMGRVHVERDEPVFRAAWERRVFGVNAAIAAGLRNVHEFRHAIERMEPRHYLAASYYERWLTAVVTLGVEKGLLDHAELERRAGGRVPRARPVAPDAGSPAPASPRRFVVGDAVRVRNMHPTGHTRCPRYVRGRRGTVVRVDPPFVLPDMAAHGARAAREPTYGVRFEARELWGEAAGPREPVYVDLWERYLEAP